ncbi:MAG: hypothetical protein U9R17_15055 [Thermodesulfobacteriota bacterium]|nr:hypothetical protein [Thermodesulfobacteriota bacterium]
MSRELIEIIANRLSGRPYDKNKYIFAIDKIIQRVYQNRYRSIVHPKKIVDTPYRADSGKRAKTIEFDSVDGFSGANFETFQNLCWDELEENNLLNKLAGLTFNDDGYLCKHIQVTFENLLQKMIFALTPGLETRKKQAYRVLKTCCIEMDKNNRRYWKLKDFKESDPEPASLERLMLISQSLKAPKLRIPKFGSRYGPSIRDIDMKEYLINVLKGAGGMAAYNDILSLIKEKFSIETIRVISPSSQGDRDYEEGKYSGEEQISKLISEAEGSLLSSDHILMAKEIVNKMDSQMKNLYYKRYIEEKTLKDIARDMGCNTTSVYNKTKKITDYLKYHFEKPDHLTETGERDTFEEIEERKAVIKYTSELIEREIL